MKSAAYARRVEKSREIVGVSTVTFGSKNEPTPGWVPWLIATAAVMLWTFFKVANNGQRLIHWPGLDKAVSITLYQDKPYAAVWTFQPLAAGTAVLSAALLTALFVRLPLPLLWQCVVQTLRQIWQAVLTVMLIVGLAYVMNYSGLAYTLGLAVASAGHAFVLFSPFLGWIAVFLSGSDTSGNALFGSLQVVAARQLHLNPLLFAATNSSGGVLGKMISPQNIATGVSVTQLKGKEGAVLARTFVHSVVLTLVLVLIVIVQQYVFPGIIPSFTGSR
jgi:lactate permease